MIGRVADDMKQAESSLIAKLIDETDLKELHQGVSPQSIPYTLSPPPPFI